MKRIKSLTTLLAMTALAAMQGTRKVMPTAPKSINNVPRAKGIKLFNIDGTEVWALNEKNVIRKAKKQIG